MDPSTRQAVEAATFQRLIKHLQQHPEAQNIDLMILADFCRNCLSKWYRAEAAARGVSIEDEEAREIVYGMPYSQWKAEHQAEATPAQMAQLKARQEAKELATRAK